MPAASPATVRAAFDAVQTSVASDDVLRKAARVCEEFGLAADALASHWESFALNNSATFDTDSLSSKALDALRAHVKRAEAARRKKQARSTTFRRGAGGSSLNKVSIKGAFSTPSPPKRSLPTSSSQTQKAAKTAKTANAVASAQAGRMKSFVKMTSTYKERPLKSRGVHAAKPFNGEALRQGGASATKGGAAPQHRCKITLLSEELSGDITKTGAMHMYTPPARKAEVLERELHVMAERLIRAHNLGGAPADGEDGMEASSSSSSSSSSSKAALADTLLEPVGMPSQTSVLMCGRVCCHVESRDGVGTLNAESLLLEGSRSRSNGVRVRLDVSRVPSLDLFPGQIVIVRGTNPSGTTMIAEQIYSSAPAPRATTSVADLRAMNHADASRPADLDDEGGITDVAPSLGGRPLEMLVAAGPFCVVDDLEYEPLEDFVNEVIERKPDVVLLIGPFVDTTNQKIKLGDIQLDGGETGPMPVNYMDLFRYRVTAAIERIAPECPSCQILMVPHPDDAHHQSTYPQPKFNMQELIPEFMYDAAERAQFMKSVTLLPNPCVISVNEVKIGINAADIMRHLLPEDVHRVSVAPGAAKPPRVPFSARLPAHIWEQNSFYPLYPAGKQVALDLRRADQLTSQLREMTPDVMILASKLNHFANDCKGVLCMNPGRLTKGVSAGTYARVVMQPFSEEALDQQGGNLDVELEHDCLKRMSVSILRI